MIVTSEDNYKALDLWLKGKKKVFLVHDESLEFHTDFVRKLGSIDVPLVHFSDFCSNPLYESVVAGVEAFRRAGCDAIMAVGGGSAIDVAKTVKLYSGLDVPGDGGAWLKLEPVAADIPFLAMPTTAGTGSEATRYAVLYYNDAKQSITSSSIIPDVVIMNPSALETLPPYQRKATMCDALSHAVEAYWSVNSTPESNAYAKAAIEGVISNMEGYLSNTPEGNAGMLMAAHKAGQAINITQTTAGHAMCYKITSMFGCAHGHAAMLCNRILYPWMIDNVDKCIDPRGSSYLMSVLDEIGVAMGCAGAAAGAAKLLDIFQSLDLDVPGATPPEFGVLCSSVNPVRLKNHPIALDEKSIESLYVAILE